MMTQALRILSAGCIAIALLVVSGCSSDDKVNNAPVVPPTGGLTRPELAVTIPANAATLGTAAYGTNPLVIQAGTRVTWTNQDTAPHTATSTDGTWDSGTLNPGQSFSFDFTEAGTYPYYSVIDGMASMSGVIEVAAAASPSPSPSASPSASPSVSPLPDPSASPSPSPSVSPSPVMPVAGAPAAVAPARPVR